MVLFVHAFFWPKFIFHWHTAAPYGKPIISSHAGILGLFVLLSQVYGDDEWSFGFCEQGTGVFSCPSGKNPMYTYREFIVLGKTNCSIFKVNQILRELSREWPGSSYDLLSKNCNHFCDEFCERLGVPKLPGKHLTIMLLIRCAMAFFFFFG